ncbi:hypothetical protein ACFLUZ_04885, partial [Chloroflexota bacterium]
PAPAPAPKPAPAPAPAPKPAPSPTFEPMQLTFSNVHTPDSNKGLESQFFMDYVTKETGGAITWEVYWGGALAPGAAQAELVKEGTIDLCNTSALYTPALFPTAGFTFAFPFLTDNEALIMKAWNQVQEETPQVEEMFTKQNVKKMAFQSGYWYNFMSREPLQTLED